MLVTRNGGLKSTDKVLLLGASGGLGTAALQICKLFGCKVVACSSSEKKLSQLSQIGADHVINTERTDFVDACGQIFGHKGIDLCINFIGGDTWQKSVSVLRRGGRLLVCGAKDSYRVFTDLRYLWRFEISIIGSNGWTKSEQETILQYTGEGKIKPIIDRVFPLSEIRKAVEVMENREIFGKIALDV